MDLVRLIPFDIEIETAGQKLVNGEVLDSLKGRTWTVVGYLEGKYGRHFLLTRAGELTQWVPQEVCKVVK